MKLKFLTSKEKREIVNELKERFGIAELPYLLLETGKEKIRAFSGSMTREEIKELSQIANVEIIGMYFVKKENKLRLSFDASVLLRDEGLKNTIETNNSEKELWLRGDNLDIAAENGVYLIKNGSDLLGCGISDGKKIINCVPKERRIRKNHS